MRGLTPIVAQVMAQKAKSALSIISALMWLCPLGFAENASADTLFNGMDLTGWTATEHPGLWTVEEGEIVGRWDKPEDKRAHSFLVHEGIFDDFHLRFEVKLEDNEGNSGVQFRSRFIESGKFEGRVKGYQADIGPGWWGKLFDEHGAGKGAEANTLWAKSGEHFVKEGDWNVYEIIAVGPRIQTKINGNLSADFTDDGSRATEGFFALQLHWGLRAKEIRYRNFVLLPNPKIIENQTMDTVKATAEGLQPGQSAALPLDPSVSYPLRTTPLSDEAYATLTQGAGSGALSDLQLKKGNVIAPILSPDDEQRAFVLAEGFEIELVVSEGLGSQKIIDIAFDTKGWMWACTASEYPADSLDESVPFRDALEGLGVQRSERVARLWREGGIDQILIFDNPTAAPQEVASPIIFSSGHAMPTGVLPYKNGVIVVEGERLKYLADTDGDERADRITLLADGFGVQDTHTGAHGLKYMPGDWVVILNGVLNWGDVRDASGRTVKFHRSGAAYIRPDGRDFKIVQKGFQNIWGFHLGIEGDTWLHEANNIGYPTTPFYEHLSAPMTTSEEDFYRDYMALYPPSSSIDLEGTSLSGLTRSDDLVGGFPPEWQTRFLIAHPSPRKIQSVEVSRQSDDSFTVARTEDLLTSGDPNFRPIDVEFGPDGCLYIVDWYNPIISHNEVERDHPLRNKQHTRIWRVRHQSQPKHPVPVNMAEAPTAKLVDYLQSGNSWEMRSAWKQIAYRQDPSVAAELKSLVADREALPRHRIHALWSLESLHSFDWNLWKDLLRDESRSIRTEALRSLRQLEPDLNVTFATLRDLKERETEFEVNKALFNYFVEARNLDDEHIDWLLQFSRPDLKLGGRKVIWHHVPSWEEFVPQHYSDMVRIALEAHPDAVWSYLQNADRGADTTHYVIEKIVPYLPDEYIDKIISDLEPEDMQVEGLRNFALTRFSGKTRRIVERYWSTLDPAQAVSLLVDSGVGPTDALVNALLVPALEEISASPKTATPQERAYLKGLAYAQGLDLINLQTWPAASRAFSRSYVETIKADHPGLLPLLPRLGIDVQGLRRGETADIVSLMMEYSERFDPNKTGELVSYIKSLDKNQRTTLYSIFGESANAMAHLVEALKQLPATGSSLDYNTLLLLQARYDFTVGAHQGLANRTQEARSILDERLEASRQNRQSDLDAQMNRFTKAANRLPSANTKNGEAIFQGLCLSCHAAGDEGVGIAPNLEGSQNRGLEGLVTAIVDPDLALEGSYKLTRVQLFDGRFYEGLTRPNKSGLTVYFMGGGKVEAPRSEIVYQQSFGRSFMNTGLTNGLDDKQISDLLGYILAL